MFRIFILFVSACFTAVTASSLQCSSETSWTSNKIPGTCDFENGTCGYYIREPWNYTASYKKDKWYTPIVAPDGGHFIVQSRHSSFIDSFGRFESPDIPAGDYCLTFRYYITYSAVRLLGNTSTGNMFCNLTEQSLETVAWKNMSVELHENTTFKLSFNSIHVRFESYVYKDTAIVDDVVLSHLAGTTPPEPTTTPSLEPTTPTHEPTTQTPEPTKQTPEPTTPTPKPTTPSLEPTTQTPEPTTQTPEPTTQTPEPTTPTPKPTTPSFEPTTQTPEPTTPTPKPTTTTAKPTTQTPEPTTQTPEPTTPTPEPTTSTPEPTTPKPTTTPKSTTPTPEPTTPTPAITTTVMTSSVSVDISTVSATREDCAYISTKGSCPFNSTSDVCGYSLSSGWTPQHGQFLFHGRPFTYFDNNPQNDSYYIVYETTSSSVSHAMLSPCLPSGSYCLSLWYVLPTSAANVEILSGNTVLHTLLSIRKWTKVSLNFTSPDDFKLSIRVAPISHTTLFALDDIRLFSNIKVSANSNSPSCVSSAQSTISSLQTQGTLRLEDVIHHGCTSNGWNITINMDLMKQLYPNVSTNYIYFGDNSCQGKKVGSYLVFQQGFRDCLTSERISGDTFMYENNLFYAIYDPINPFILRQHKWTYTVECDVNRNDVTSSHVQHNVSTHHATETTHYGISLTFYKDANFMTQLSGNPVHINVGDDLYTKVFTTVPDWSIKMRLHTCYTDNGNDVNKNSTYYLIKDGCEVDANTHIISQSTHETRFVFQDFEYTSYTEGLSVHCNATFCKSDDFTAGCLQTCNPAVLLVGK